MKCKIEFDKEKHIYYVNGIRVPGVSEILESVGVSNMSRVPEHILERACKYGNAVHSMTALCDIGHLDEWGLDDGLRKDLEGWDKFKQENGVSMKHIESIVYSKKYNFIGTLDRVADLQSGIYAGHTGILDVKTPTEISLAAYAQLDAYDIAYKENGAYNLKEQEFVKENPSDIKLIVHLSQDGNYQLHPTRPEDRGCFIPMAQVHNYKLAKGIK